MKIIVKILKNDSNEEEKSINNDESSNEYENNEEKKNLEQKKKEEDEKLKEKNKKLIKKKKISKIAKINYQKNEKIKAMSHYFLIYNILYSLQICTLCLLIMSYYILVILLYEYRKYYHLMSMLKQFYKIGPIVIMQYL